MLQTLLIPRNVTVMQRCNLKGSIYTINQNELEIHNSEVGIATMSPCVYFAVLQAGKLWPCISVMAAEPEPIDSPAFILT
jgi:hypothetical protein